MTKPIELEARARADYLEAVDWYDRSGQGSRFIAAIDRTLELLVPADRWPVLAVRRGHEIRKATVWGPFPYRIIFAELEAMILVIAIIHAARESDYWHDRI